MGLVKLVFALIFFSQAAFARKEAEVLPPMDYVACEKDADCAIVKNDCAHCCKPGIAINSQFKYQFSALYKNHCQAYVGMMCNCVEPPGRKVLAKCKAQKCIAIED